MRYTMMQKWMAFGDDYTVQDEAGRDVLFIDGKVLTLRDTLVVQDMQGRELARIVKRFLSLRRTYDIEYQGRTTTVTKELFSLFKCRFTVDMPGPNDLEAEGNFLDYEYRFTDVNGRVVAEVSKRWLTLRDSYAIDVVDGVDPVLLIAAAVVVDQCCHEEKK